MEEEGKSVFLPTVQKEISLAVRHCADYLKNKCNCVINTFKFLEMKNSCEIAGSLLYSIKDIPNLLKAVRLKTYKI